MQVAEKFGMGIEQKLLFNKALLSTTGCMGPCSSGPVVVVYPDGVLYNRVTPEDVDEILESHIVNGKKVERLEISEEMWG
jgi:(2Fe-2S) ferredoxin